jgi:hypothetical protein
MMIFALSRNAPTYERMMHAATTFPGSVVIFASALKPELARLHVLLDTVGSRGIVIAENNEAQDPIYSRVSAE